MISLKRYLLRKNNIMGGLEYASFPENHEYCTSPKIEDIFKKLRDTNTWYQQFLENSEIYKQQCQLKEGFSQGKKNICDGSICQRNDLKQELEHNIENEKREGREHITAIVQTADTHKELQEYDKALEKYERAKELKIRNGIQDIELSDIYGSIAQMQIRLKNIEGARESIKEAKENTQKVYKEILSHLDKMIWIGFKEADKKYEIAKKIFELSSLHLGLEMTESEFRALLLDRVENGINKQKIGNEFVGITLVDEILMKHYNKIRHDIMSTTPEFPDLSKLDFNETEKYEKIEKKLEKDELSESEEEEVVNNLEAINYGELVKRLLALENKNQKNENRVGNIEVYINLDTSKSKEIIRNDEKLNMYYNSLLPPLKYIYTGAQSAKSGKVEGKKGVVSTIVSMIPIVGKGGEFFVNSMENMHSEREIDKLLDSINNIDDFEKTIERLSVIITQENKEWIVGQSKTKNIEKKATIQALQIISKLQQDGMSEKLRGKSRDEIIQMLK